MAQHAPERRALTSDELAGVTDTLPAWEVRDGALYREISFGGFSEAWAFMSRVALAAEKLDHHPDWSNSWATVRIALSTHDLGGLSTFDVELARRVDALLT